MTLSNLDGSRFGTLINLYDFYFFNCPMRERMLDQERSQGESV